MTKATRRIPVGTWGTFSAVMGDIHWACPGWTLDGGGYPVLFGDGEFICPDATGCRIYRRRGRAVWMWPTGVFTYFTVKMESGQ